MELKFLLYSSYKYFVLLLIEPYGIEIRKWSGYTKTSYKLLIEPYGIEINCKYYECIKQLLLIEPYGIEIG